MSAAPAGRNVTDQQDVISSKKGGRDATKKNPDRHHH
jgi:hypothetical protein